ncbi:hypothetical protein DFAR_420004 [Desulfarculales bacterium]
MPRLGLEQEAEDLRAPPQEVLLTAYNLIHNLCRRHPELVDGNGSSHRAPPAGHNGSRGL